MGRFVVLLKRTLSHFSPEMDCKCTEELVQFVEKLIENFMTHFDDFILGKHVANELLFLWSVPKVWGNGAIPPIGKN